LIFANFRFFAYICSLAAYSCRFGMILATFVDAENFK
jgi:hypothetical protein